MAILVCPECGEEYDDRLKCFTCDLFLEEEIKLSGEQVELLDQIIEYRALEDEYHSLDDGEEDPDLEDPDIED
ncbi:hypothetical protein [Methylobacter tundripaludum]|uniref:Uncharacterized protein n=1 Tax=Methylobacter tundripaludum (strain ATCC BAA-1195 / DSM 17260 / SV96) TaxID=697282 RepID=G3J0E1_METTV|nr:hypothetical protein [Methylobacter tundripaludum]EGW20663.1 hypothetical protein Mettu_3812 [Methylobacter tundripaludum SV96]